MRSISMPHGSTTISKYNEEDHRCFQVASPALAFLKCLRNLSIQKQSLLPMLDMFNGGLVEKCPFQKYEKVHSCCWRWPKTQLNTNGHTASKINIINELAYKNKALVIILQKTHCMTADKLAIPDFLLAGSVLSRKQCLAMFVHEQLEWTLVNQSLEQSETEWLCKDFAGCKIINIYKPPPLQVAIHTYGHHNIPTS